MIKIDKPLAEQIVQKIDPCHNVQVDELVGLVPYIHGAHDEYSVYAVKRPNVKIKIWVSPIDGIHIMYR